MRVRGPEARVMASRFPGGRRAAWSVTPVSAGPSRVPSRGAELGWRPPGVSPATAPRVDVPARRWLPARSGPDGEGAALPLYSTPGQRRLQFPPGPGFPAPFGGERAPRRGAGRALAAVPAGSRRARLSPAAPAGRFGCFRYSSAAGREFPRWGLSRCQG